MDTRVLVLESNVREMMFSEKKYVLIDRRPGILPARVEQQLFLDCTTELRVVDDVNEIMDSALGMYVILVCSTHGVFIPIFSNNLDYSPSMISHFLRFTSIRKYYFTRRSVCKYIYFISQE